MLGEYPCQATNGPALEHWTATSSTRVRNETYCNLLVELEFHYCTATIKVGVMEFQYPAQFNFFGIYFSGWISIVSHRKPSCQEARASNSFGPPRVWLAEDIFPEICVCSTVLWWGAELCRVRYFCPLLATKTWPNSLFLRWLIRADSGPAALGSASHRHILVFIFQNTSPTTTLFEPAITVSLSLNLLKSSFWIRDNFEGHLEKIM